MPSETDELPDFLGGADADRTRDLLNAICGSLFFAILLGSARYASTACPPTTFVPSLPGRDRY
jgi:hypothetical protein